MSLTRTLVAGTTVTAAALAFLIAGVSVSYVKQVSQTLPDHMTLAEWKPAEGTVILTRDGGVMGTHAAENRQFTPLQEIPKLVVDAFIAAEDGKYWDHSGIDPTAIVRAALSNLKAGTGTRPEGGSTITQQVVKNVILTSERTLDRKLREALIALRADRDIGKYRILEIYLNEIYFGSGAYGVAAAAETYFGKKLDELNVAEAALLAGLPKAPSAANPFVNPVKAAGRREYVLNRMLKEGFISQDDLYHAVNVPLPTRHEGKHEEAGHAFWYPQEAVRRILLSKLGADGLYRGGREIGTTIDRSLQLVVHEELRKGLVSEDRKSGWRGPIARGVPVDADFSASVLSPPPGAEDWLVGLVVEAGRDARVRTRTGEIILQGRDLGWATSKKRADAVLAAGDVVLVADLGNGHELVQVPEVQGAVVVLDPRTGGILALDGGFSGQISEFNRATQAKRQTGSAFKPFVYLAAMELGYDAMSPLLDAPIAIEQGPGKGDWRPESASAGQGLITLRRSLEQSRNMSTVRLLYDIGMESVSSIAGKLGFPIPEGASFSMALGATEATPLELATAYAALANGGRPISPTFFLAEETDIAQVEPQIDPIAVAQLSSVLEGVVTSGTARRAFEGFAGRLAAKTGTTNDARDAWLAAYGPDFVAVAWIGRDDHKPLPKGAGGGSTAAPIIRSILDRAGRSISFGEFMLPFGATTILADRDSGLPSEGGNVVEIVREGSVQ